MPSISKEILGNTKKCLHSCSIGARQVITVSTSSNVGRNHVTSAYQFFSIRMSSCNLSILHFQFLVKMDILSLFQMSLEQIHQKSITLHLSNRSQGQKASYLKTSRVLFYTNHWTEGCAQHQVSLSLMQLAVEWIRQSHHVKLPAKVLTQQFRNALPVRKSCQDRTIIATYHSFAV